TASASSPSTPASPTSCRTDSGRGGRLSELQMVVARAFGRRQQRAVGGLQPLLRPPEEDSFAPVELLRALLREHDTPRASGRLDGDAPPGHGHGGAAHAQPDPFRVGSAHLAQPFDLHGSVTYHGRAFTARAV